MTRTELIELMRAAGDLFDDFGGHVFSGGFSLQEEKIFELASNEEGDSVKDAYNTIARVNSCLGSLKLDENLDQMKEANSGFSPNFG